MVNAKRVTFNTSVLYLRIFFTSILSLITVRVTLNALGEEDFGIYNVIAGVVAMLNFLNAAMTTSSVRYLSIELSSNNKETLSKTYSTTVVLHILLATLVSILIFLFKDIFINSLLNLPSERKDISEIVYLTMIFSTFFTILSVPLDGLTNANEDLFIFSLFDIFSSVAKLGISYLILKTSNDKLLFYTILMTLVPVLLYCIKFIWVKMRYSEVAFSFKMFDKVLGKEMFYFSSWGMIGALSGIFKNQGIALALNIFFGAVSNAAYAITLQINSLVNYFAQTLLKAINPSIIKSYGRGEIVYMNYLVKLTSIISYMLLSLIIVPLIISLDFILKFWLKEVPPYTENFVIILLITSLVVQLSIGLILGFQATGKIKKYQIIVSGLSILSMPLCYMVYYFGGRPDYGLFCVLIIEFFASLIRVYLASKLYSLNFRKYILDLFVKCIFCSVVVFTLILLFQKYVLEANNVFHVLTMFFLSVLLHVSLFYCIVFDFKERQNISKYTNKFFISRKS